MKKKQIHIETNDFDQLSELKNMNPNLVLLFGSPELFNDHLGSAVSTHLPNCITLGCSTAGEISEDGVFDKSLVATGIEFDSIVEMKVAKHPISNDDDGLKTGKNIGDQLKGEHLKMVFVLSQGVNVNGSHLIEGIIKGVGEKVAVTGGLAGDDGAFEKTFTLLNGEISDSNIIALGIYGEDLGISYASRGGWQPFGPVRTVTKAENNVLFELDGEPALDVYKKYLGDKATELPASGLLYPFAVLNDNQDSTGIIRTILGIDEEKGSLTLAGDIHQGGQVKLMHTRLDGLVDGAKSAAEVAKENAPDFVENGLGILISCVGRKLVMGEDTDEEIDAVKDILGDNTMVSGFYSYGEICPFEGVYDSRLHNQTMTLTYLYDKKKAA